MARHRSTVCGSIVESLESRTLLSSYHSIGLDQKTLYIIAKFSDQSSYPQSVSSATSEFSSLNTFWKDSSYDQFSMKPTIVQVTLPGKASSYTDTGKVRSDALAQAKNQGFDDANYTFDAVRYDGGPGSFAGLAYVGAKGAWLKSSTWGVAAHEFGHNLGLSHAHAWNPSGSNPVGSGSSVEYGDTFDVMGDAYGNATGKEYDAYEKYKIGWITSGEKNTISTDGTYTIYADDLGTLADQTQKHALRFYGADGKEYWIDLRENSSLSSTIKNSVFLHYQSGGATYLVDTKPSTETVDDAMIAIGTTFKNSTAGISINPISRTTDSNGGVYVKIKIDVYPLAAAALTRSAAPSEPLFSSTPVSSGTAQLDDELGLIAA